MDIIVKAKKPRLTKEEKEKVRIKEELKAKKLAEKELLKEAKDLEQYNEINEQYISKNPWYFKDDIFLSSMLNSTIQGFIYAVEEISTGKIYIGQKHVWTKKLKIVNKKRKKITIESDWKHYYGSSAYIMDKVEREGTSDFKRYILALCVSSGQMNYIEMKIQMDLRVLEFPEKYINGYIGGRISGAHIKYDQIIDMDLIMLNKLYKESYFGFINNECTVSSV